LLKLENKLESNHNWISNEQDIVKNMKERGHNVTDGEYTGGAFVCAITVEKDGIIYANSDWGKSGGVDGIGSFN
jgi:gamma-glutamyltranspeptidase/glutathione hydrolase/leukotriene-C4 hydrolase